MAEACFECRRPASRHVQAKYRRGLESRSHRTVEVETRLQRASTDREFIEQFAHPVDHGASGGIALEMILNEQPYLDALRQQGRTKPPIGQQRAAGMFRQYADGGMRLDQRAYH